MENSKDSEGGKYDVYEVIKVQLPPPSANKVLDMQIHFLDESNASAWAIDGMLIDEELLYAEDAEADRIYQELKQKSLRRKNLEENEHRLSLQMMKEVNEEESRDSFSLSSSQTSASTGRMSTSGKSQSFEKIKQFLQKSDHNAKLDFTQGLLNFANKIEKKFLLEAVLPALKLLANDSPDIKKALLDQFIPLINYNKEQCG